MSQAMLDVLWCPHSSGMMWPCPFKCCGLRDKRREWHAGLTGEGAMDGAQDDEQFDVGGNEERVIEVW